MDCTDLKLQRAIWIALFKEKIDTRRLDDLIKLFWKQYNYLQMLSKINFLDSDLKEEIEQSKKTFIEKISITAEDFFKQEDYRNALKCYQNILKVDNKNEDNILKSMECAKKMELYDLEVSLAEKLDTKENPKQYKVLADAYKRNKEYDKSAEAYKKYMSLGISSPGDELSYLGCLYFDKFKAQKNKKDAQLQYDYFMKALTYHPDDKIYVKNAIAACSVSYHHEEEIELWKKYIKIAELTEENKFSYGLVLLKTRHFEEYGQYLDARFKMTNGTVYPKFDVPRWTGKEDLKDKTILVRYEQGFGDTILYFYHIKHLKKLAKKVICIVQNNMYPLLKDNEWDIPVYPVSTDINSLEFDYEIPTMSLPYALNLTYETIGTKAPYIKAKKEDVEEFKKKHFKNNKFKIGIAFKGNVIGNKTRDITLKDLSVLDKLKNVEFYCFSKDVTDLELKVFKKNKAYNIAKDFKDFKDTAVAMDAMDLIISTDNCILNLAGAMDKKAFGLFNYEYELRWYDLNENDCGWYKSVKPFICEDFNEWKPAIDRVLKEIKKINK